MIIGKIVEFEDIRKHLQSTEEFREYCISLVPVEFRHVRGIISNQLYFCLLLLRSNNSVGWDVKNTFIRELMPAIRIVGYTNQLVEAQALLDVVSKDKMLRFKRSDKN